MPAAHRQLTPPAAVRFRARLRAARANALADSEGFLPLVQEIEELGRFLTNDPGAHGLAKYSRALIELSISAPTRGSDFELLLDALRQARNDAAHLGAAARRTTGQAITVALILEDAMAHKVKLKLVKHYMVEGPTCAEGWQTIAMLRRTMLQHQFSVLPHLRGKKWHLLTDVAVAHFLRGERDARLMLSLDEAVQQGLNLGVASTTEMGTSIDEAYKSADTSTLLVLDEHENLRGIITPFDLL